jgi:hypothetical protein
MWGSALCETIYQLGIVGDGSMLLQLEDFPVFQVHGSQYAS